MKGSKLNIIISLIVCILGVTTFVYSFFDEISILHLIFAIVNIFWIVFEGFIKVKSKNTKKYKILFLMLLIWCLLLTVNIIFVYFNIFVVYSIYSSIILLLIVDVLYEIAKPWSKSSLADNFGSLPLGMISLILALIPMVVIFDTIKELKNNKNK